MVKAHKISPETVINTEHLFHSFSSVNTMWKKKDTSRVSVPSTEDYRQTTEIFEISVAGGIF